MAYVKNPERIANKDANSGYAGLDASGNVPSSMLWLYLTEQIDVSGNTLGTVYRNTSGKPMFVQFIGTAGAATVSIVAKSDAATPPTVFVAETTITTAGTTGYISFWVLNNNYYAITISGAGPAVASWIELT